MSVLQSRRSGLLLVLAGTALVSLTGLFVRAAALDTWTLVGWRSLFAALALGLFWGLSRRGRWSAARPTLSGTGLATALIIAFSSLTYVFALQLTSVAAVMTVYAALPFVAAGIAVLRLKEPLTRRTLVAAGIAFVGILVMSGGALSLRDGLGILAALAMTVAFAAALVQAKKHPELDMTLLTAASALLLAALAFPMMREGVPAPGQLLACAALGILSMSLANILILVGGRAIGSAEAGLVSLLDVVLGPFWVWLVFGEAVGPAVLSGGALVVLSVGWYLGPQRRRSRSSPCPAG